MTVMCPNDRSYVKWLEYDEDGICIGLSKDAPQSAVEAYKKVNPNYFSDSDKKI